MAAQPSRPALYAPMITASGLNIVELLALIVLGGVVLLTIKHTSRAKGTFNAKDGQRREGANITL